jgi:hypothetical protein
MKTVFSCVVEAMDSGFVIERDVQSGNFRGWVATRPFTLRRHDGSFLEFELGDKVIPKLPTKKYYAEQERAYIQFMWDLIKPTFYAD